MPWIMFLPEPQEMEYSAQQIMEKMDAKWID